MGFLTPDLRFFLLSKPVAVFEVGDFGDLTALNSSTSCLSDLVDVDVLATGDSILRSLSLFNKLSSSYFLSYIAFCA